MSEWKAAELQAVRVEKTMWIGDLSSETSVDIAGYGAGDAIEIMRAFLRETEEDQYLQDT